MTDEHKPPGQGPVTAPDNRPSAPPGTRASDADREDVADQLREAVEDGRLDLDELDERLAVTFAAKTHRELATVTEDLPANPRTAAAAAPLSLVTKSGSSSRTGHWTVPSKIIAQCTSGTIKLDFTQAVCPLREVTIEAEATSGTVLLIVPFGWTVDVDNVSSTSGSVVNKVSGPPDPRAPVLRVNGKVRSGTVKARHPRRTFWQWLTRVPRDPRSRRT